eukprot:TRINITY_DN31623_c0_g1_i1.p1 TRINITY_DN31623_c0_g1~~TRINITY_DN31623_c0_g1_i1.p1  ORF type:complete len:602 (+),score=184.51 TRINITY_DN31623_c0_g1_i1:95-1807(+)
MAASLAQRVPRSARSGSPRTGSPAAAPRRGDAGGRRLLSDGALLRLLHDWLMLRSPECSGLDREALQRAMHVAPELRPALEHVVLHTQGDAARGRELRAALRRAGHCTDGDSRAAGAVQRLNGRLAELKHLSSEARRALDLAQADLRAQCQAAAAAAAAATESRRAAEAYASERAQLRQLRGQLREGAAALRQACSAAGSPPRAEPAAAADAVHSLALRLRADLTSPTAESVPLSPPAAAQAFHDGSGGDGQRGAPQLTHLPLSAGGAVLRELQRIVTEGLALAQAAGGEQPPRAAPPLDPERAAAAARALQLQQLQSYAAERRLRDEAAATRRAAEGLLGQAASEDSAMLQWRMRAVGAAALCARLKTAAAEIGDERQQEGAADIPSALAAAADTRAALQRRRELAAHLAGMARRCGPPPGPPAADPALDEAARRAAELAGVLRESAQKALDECAAPPAPPAALPGDGDWQALRAAAAERDAAELGARARALRAAAESADDEADAGLSEQLAAVVTQWRGCTVPHAETAAGVRKARAALAALEGAFAAVGEEARLAERRVAEMETLRRR